MRTHFLIFLLASVGVLRASQAIAPIDDASVTVGGSVDNPQYTYLTASFGEEGVLLFSTAATTPYTNFSLEINPYGLPFFANTLNVYGYSNSGNSITADDYGKGILLGTYSDVSSLGFGQEDFLDISSFVQSVEGNNFEIILSDPGTDYAGDELSDLAHNYGTPSEIFASVPEPSTWMMLAASLAALTFFYRRRRLNA